jgi:hypothetical protein
MKKDLTIFLASLAAVAAPAVAHHSYSMFDLNKKVVLEATVTQFKWHRGRRRRAGRAGAVGHRDDQPEQPDPVRVEAHDAQAWRPRAHLCSSAP